MTSGQRARPLPVLVSLAAWLVGVPLAHAALPWALSLLGPRYGWADAAPGAGNALGLLAVGAGAGCLLWVMAAHFARAREWTSLSLTPTYVLAEGPYAFSRNPMYLGELLLWLGWAVFYGSPIVLVGAVLLALGMQRAIRREERTLETRFGEPYRGYLRRVPRWLGLARREPRRGLNP